MVQGTISSVSPRQKLGHGSSVLKCSTVSYRSCMRCRTTSAAAVNIDHSLPDCQDIHSDISVCCKHACIILMFDAMLAGMPCKTFTRLYSLTTHSLLSNNLLIYRDNMFFSRPISKHALKLQKLCISSTVVYTIVYTMRASSDRSRYMSKTACFDDHANCLDLV